MAELTGPAPQGLHNRRPQQKKSSMTTKRAKYKKTKNRPATAESQQTARLTVNA